MELPGQHAPGVDPGAETQTNPAAEKKETQPSVAAQQVSNTVQEAEAKVEALADRSETPSTSQPSEDTVASSPTTPSSVQPAKPATTTPSAPAAAKPAVPAVPALPVVPALPKASPKETKPAVSAEQRPAAAAPEQQTEKSTAPTTEGETVAAEAETTEAAPPAPAWSKPKLWTGLFSKPGGAAASTSAAATTAQAQTNGNTAEGSAAAPATGGFAKANASSLAQALQAYRPITPDKLAFLEPRGLVNTGNMCYMNSVSSHHST